jgi:hypothetical protein
VEIALCAASLVDVRIVESRYQRRFPTLSGRSAVEDEKGGYQGLPAVHQPAANFAYSAKSVQR